MIEAIAKYADSFTYNASVEEIYKIIAEKFHDISIPAGILDLNDLFEYLVSVEHADKEVFDQVRASLEPTFLKLVSEEFRNFYYNSARLLSKAGYDEQEIESFLNSLF